MTNFVSLFQDLQARQLIKQTTSEQLDSLLTKEKLTLYCGFDPSAPSLHVGSLLQIALLKRFHAQGHKIIAVVGGATGMIGDPSGKTEERKLLDETALRENEKGVARLLHHTLGSDVLILNNYDWFKEFSFIEFLRTVGKNFSVNTMLSKDSVRARLEDRAQGISYTEFSYMLLQSYDFYYLFKNHKCVLQVGGSDQWGNITSGIDLIRRNEQSGQTEVAYGITTPLVTKADGSKFGKTESGTIWLTADRTHPMELYQFLLSTSDAEVGQYLKWFSFQPLERIDELLEEHKRAPESRIAQKALAKDIVEWIHGAQALKEAEQTSQALFGKVDLNTLSKEALLKAFQGAPIVEIVPLDTEEAGIPIVDLCVKSGLFASKGAARKEIQAGGVYLNQERVTSDTTLVTPQHLLHNAYVILRKGKKNNCILHILCKD